MHVTSNTKWKFENNLTPIDSCKTAVKNPNSYKGTPRWAPLGAKMSPDRISRSNLIKMGEVGWNRSLCIVLKGFSEKKMFLAEKRHFFITKNQQKCIVFAKKYQKSAFFLPKTFFFQKILLPQCISPYLDWLDSYPYWTGL